MRAYLIVRDDYTLYDKSFQIGEYVTFEKTFPAPAYETHSTNLWTLSGLSTLFCNWLLGVPFIKRNLCGVCSIHLEQSYIAK